jgi:hypothetical protein
MRNTDPRSIRTERVAPRGLDPIEVTELRDLRRFVGKAIPSARDDIAPSRLIDIDAIGKMPLA